MNPHSLGIISAALAIDLVGLVIDPTWNRYWEIVRIAMLVVGIVGMLTTPPSRWWLEVKPCEKPPSSPCSSRSHFSMAL
jgi:hypothetical protein